MSDALFPLHSEVPVLGDDEIHVWHVDGPAGAPPRALSGMAHLALGRLLASYGGRTEPPAILRGDHGKPYAADLDGIEFNLSHSGRHALVAIARRLPLGIDIEAQGRTRSIDDVAQRYFAPAEAAALHALPEALRRVAFLRLWTGKEAVLKALGHGLSFGLDRVEFELGEDGHLGALRQVDHVDAQAGGWHWRALQVVDDYQAALAWQGPPRRLRLMRLP